MLKAQCERFGYRFIDTGTGEDRIRFLDAIYQEIAAYTSGGSHE